MSPEDAARRNERIKKVRDLAEHPSATPGERAAAHDRLNAMMGVQPRRRARRRRPVARRRVFPPSAAVASRPAEVAPVRDWRAEVAGLLIREAIRAIVRDLTRR